MSTTAVLAMKFRLVDSAQTGILHVAMIALIAIFVAITKSLEQNWTINMRSVMQTQSAKLNVKVDTVKLDLQIVTGIQQLDAKLICVRISSTAGHVELKLLMVDNASTGKHCVLVLRVSLALGWYAMKEVVNAGLDYSIVMVLESINETADITNGCETIQDDSNCGSCGITVGVGETCIDGLSLCGGSPCSTAVFPGDVQVECKSDVCTKINCDFGFLDCDGILFLGVTKKVMWTTGVRSIGEMISTTVVPAIKRSRREKYASTIAYF
jgi:hypothetical protein